ncbi:MAG: hypothetical protein CL550_06815 [Alcanivorax sp.]|nr:hypothetical protein [Alcanivorax sp.]
MLPARVQVQSRQYLPAQLYPRFPMVGAVIVFTGIAIIIGLGEIQLACPSRGQFALTVHGQGVESSGRLFAPGAIQ